MAFPIIAIPTLYGEEASRFLDMAVVTESKYDISPKRGLTYRTLQVVQERAESPKAPSPGHRPGHTRSQQCAL